ncbi:MAG: hypothetical protein FJX76_11120 [Armatimonadetes bacterium]|nr:hypothetical protein [Armatimonadota bacterium]
MAFPVQRRTPPVPPAADPRIRDSVRIGGGIPGPVEAPALTGALRVDGSECGGTMPGQPAEWTLTYRDANGTPVTRFEANHEKPMHLIVVSKDLESFAHVHPILSDDGTFTIRVNEESDDPDNINVARAVPKPGEYHLFAEVKPEGGDLALTRFSTQAAGEAEPVPLVPDPGNPGQGIRKYFTASGQPGVHGDAYQATFRTLAMPGMLHLRVKLQYASEMEHLKMVHYVDVHDVQPWMGMAAHGVLIGENGRVEERTFRHMHTGHPHVDPHRPLSGGGPHGGGPDFEFVLHGADVPPPGNYRMWMQFKHHERVVTLPFTFTV